MTYRWLRATLFHSVELILLKVCATRRKATPIVLQATKWITILSTTMIALTATAFAQGQAIPIVNGGFQNDVLGCAPGPQCFDLGVLPGWVGGGRRGAVFYVQALYGTGGSS